MINSLHVCGHVCRQISKASAKFGRMRIQHGNRNGFLHAGLGSCESSAAQFAFQLPSEIPIRIANIARLASGGNNACLNGRYQA